jgi:superfamily II DNA or RNA helicase
MKVTLPRLLAIDERSDKGVIYRQMAVPGWTGEVGFEPCPSSTTKGYVLRSQHHDGPLLLVTHSNKVPNDYLYVLRLKSLKPEPSQKETLDLSQAKWVRHQSLSGIVGSSRDYKQLAQEIQNSWAGAFSYKREDTHSDAQGLRPPQLGALHAVQAHLTVHRHPATVVMPTGTGKTEVMLSILIAERCRCVLVIVPTDALRTQIAEKFLQLGILKEFGIVDAKAKYPIVGMLTKRLNATQGVDEVFQNCNVVVATMGAIGQCPEFIRKRIASHCTHLFIDEAHHVAAPTWKRFKTNFESASILQFTATPYRNDEHPISGDIIFNYPLRQAQEDGYFKPIDFKAVLEFDPRQKDKAIAEAAVEQLRKDFDKGHILMARVNSVKRAEQVFEIYKQFSEFNPAQIHTGIKSQNERDRIKQDILSGKTRIVVCVDMLGEGFDLPELKIAAFHDIRQSLPVTLQLAGRFTRVKPQLGNATFVANVADLEVKDELRKLYQRDVDWNLMLPHLSEAAIQEEVDLVEFIKGFRRFPDELSLQNVRPKMSTVAYQTTCKEWKPDNFLKGIESSNTLDKLYSDLNPRENTLVVVTAKRVPLEWARMNVIWSWDWQLYVLYWDRDKQLLFINNSSNGGFFEKLAKAVAGEVKLISGPAVFRSLSTANRLLFQNVGLLEQLGRLIRYTMRAGSDVETGLSEAQKQGAIKSNLFGTGYADGNRTSIGCSYKGRIWSRQATNIQMWTRWCQTVGEKLVDESLDPEEVLKGTLKQELVSERPNKMPIAVDWPDIFYREPETNVAFKLFKEDAFLHQVDISIKDPAESGNIGVSISTGGCSVSLVLHLFETNQTKEFRFDKMESGEAYIKFRNKSIPLIDFFHDEPPTVWFADGSSLCGNVLVQLRKAPEPFRRARIEVWDWSHVDLRQESQGISSITNSIQYKVIQGLRQQDYAVVYDDDGSGEVADVVAIRELESAIEVEFYHCKFSSEDSPGSRIVDLYEVCGQAQKSVRWMEKLIDLFAHFLRREPKKLKDESKTRFEVGKRDDLIRIREKSRQMRVNLSVSIVQPGVSRRQASQSQLELLAVTENYLLETFKVPFRVIASS